MSQLTMRELRDIILDLIDQYKPSEARFHPSLIERQILIARNFLRKRDADRDAAKNNAIDSDWFSYREYDIEFDANGGYVTLPNGVVSLPHDMGVRVIPISGMGNPFVRFPTGWVRNYPELAFAEGNIPWELDRGYVRFPTLTEASLYTKIGINSIEDSTNVGIDDPIAMPSDMQADVQQMVFRALGIAQPEDRRADSKPVNAT
jgi:hypothetical protein